MSFPQPVLNYSFAAPVSILNKAEENIPKWLIVVVQQEMERTLASSILVEPEVENTPESSVFLERQRLIKGLENHYIFDNPQEIRRFLAEHHDLISILLEAPFYILDAFGDVPRHLELHHDPEENGATLFIVVKSPYGADEAIRREKQLADQWFLARMRNTRGRLNFTEEPL